MAINCTKECMDILKLLKTRKNVIISGSPGTGKSRLLNEVAKAFETAPIAPVHAHTPVHIPDAEIVIPEVPPAVDEDLIYFQSIWPANSRTNRKVFRTTFHQNSKNRDFITGVVPKINDSGFKVVQGILYRASEHAKLNDGAALLIIDEINRGPAVQVFGGSIVAIEPDKRLADDNSRKLETQFFEIIDPNGDIIEYALPNHLYILAAMNQADASVEPMDVAFLRRWASYQLKPDPAILRKHFSITATDPVPLVPTTVTHVYEASVLAWEAINSRIRIGRGPEFQLGHGIFLTYGDTPASDVPNALEEIVQVWNTIYTHVEEVFFGDLRGIAAVLNIKAGQTNHPYVLKETTFADEPRLE
ncbi:MAG: AAA family ATPase, partial [Fischerella sp.]|nr:AAA family ATPase [Fischerella sp.]